MWRLKLDSCQSGMLKSQAQNYLWYLFYSGCFSLRWNNPSNRFPLHFNSHYLLSTMNYDNTYKQRINLQLLIINLLTWKLWVITKLHLWYINQTWKSGWFFLFLIWHKLQETSANFFFLWFLPISAINFVLHFPNPVSAYFLSPCFFLGIPRVMLVMRSAV